MEELIFFFAGLSTLAVQLLLCFLVKRIWIKLLPTLLTGLAAALMFAMIFLSSGWDAFFFSLLFVTACIPFSACLISWIVFGVVRLLGRKKRRVQAEVPMIESLETEDIAQTEDAAE